MIKRWTASLKGRVNRAIDVASARGGLGARLGEAISGRFSGEIRAVYAGAARYHATLHERGDGGSLYNLRRNVHRLEKGLIMRPRRPVFAAGYVVETVERYESVSQGEPDEAAREVLAYAADVLKQYFAAVAPGADAGVDRARERFDATGRLRPLRTDGSAVPGEGRSPYLRETSPLEVTLSGLVQLAHRRRSCRWYDQDRPIPREFIDQAIEVAAQSPSACNRQPFEFRVYDDPGVIRRLAAIPMGTRGFAEGFPCLVVVVGKLRAFPNPRDRHVIYIDASLATMAFLYALEAQGIASCCINWPDVRPLESKLRRTISLAADERVIMMISLGYPDPSGMVPFSQKKHLSEIRSYNRP